MKCRNIFIILPLAFIATIFSGLVPKPVLAYTTGVNTSGQTVYNFVYTGAPESITLGNNVYRLETWGAQGGDVSTTFPGGKGGYARGQTILNTSTAFYVHVGGAGVFGYYTAAYNGGGQMSSGQTHYGSTGGGATDIRLTSGDWNNATGLRSRIVVAGGGGGADERGGNYGDGYGGAGGGLNGLPGQTINNTNGYGYGISAGGTQTAGGVFTWVGSDTDPGSLYTQGANNGAFGIGGGTTTPNWISPANVQTSGGGGYYGGSSGNHCGSGGGSGYVKGCAGCDTTYLANQGSITFTDISLIAGNASMPSTSGGTETGHSGNGYARITLVSTRPTVNVVVGNTGTWVKSGDKLNISGTITDPDTQNFTVSYSLSSNTTPGAWTVCRSASSTSTYSKSTKM